MAITAAMKKVLSPISDDRMTKKLLRKPRKGEPSRKSMRATAAAAAAPT